MLSVLLRQSSLPNPVDWERGVVVFCATPLPRPFLLLIIAIPDEVFVQASMHFE